MKRRSFLSSDLLVGGGMTFIAALLYAGLFFWSHTWFVFEDKYVEADFKSWIIRSDLDPTTARLVARLYPSWIENLANRLLGGTASWEQGEPK